MRVACTQENLLKGVSVVSRSVGKDLNLPILANMLISAKKGQLKLSATNLEIGISCLVRSRIEEEGAVTVPARLLLNYVSSLSNANVELSADNSMLKVKCGGYSGEIKGIGASEFPLIPKIENKSFCSVRGALFKEALSRVIFAVSRDGVRAEIAGVFLSVSEKQMRLAATNGHRLGVQVIKVEEGVDKEISMIVPAQTAQELMGVLDEGAEIVRIHTLENQVKFCFEDIVVVSRLIDGQYPDFLKIIPSKFSTVIELDKNDFLKAIKTTSLFSKGDANELKISVKVKEKEIDLIAESGQIGKNISKVSCRVKGDDVEAVFNSKYLLEGLNAISQNKVNLKLLGVAGHGMLKGVGHENYLYVVMPIRK